jgi:uncharacterized membrane protein
VRSRLLLFAILFAWCALLIAGHVSRAQRSGFVWLGWNLILAAVPAFAAAGFVRAQRRGARIFFFVIWLLFLPNAPYLVTDFVHLEPTNGVPLWFDIALLASCAGTGLLLAYTSTADVQIAITRIYGRAAGWIIAIAALLLTGFGIYLGRFMRWNSWDPIANPRQILELPPAIPHMRAFGVTFVYGVAVSLGYVALRTLFARPPNQ